LLVQESIQRNTASEGFLVFLTSGNQGEPSSDQLADVSPLLPLSKKHTKTLQRQNGQINYAKTSMISKL